MSKILCLFLFVFLPALFAQTPTVTLTNLTRGGNNERVGDSFSLTVTGPPGQAVTLTATKDGVPFATNAYQGTTDSMTGSWTTSGVQSSGYVGHWTETWSVGGVAASPTIDFWVYRMITLLINGSLSPVSPAWTLPASGSGEYEAVAATYGVSPTTYFWIASENDLYDVTIASGYAGIYAGGHDLATFLGSLNLNSADELAIVAHSHGGNVVKVASWYQWRPSQSNQIQDLINLGTPQNWDLSDPYSYILGLYPSTALHYCQVSSDTDPVQFSGAGVVQVANATYDTTEAGIYAANASQDLYYYYQTGDQQYYDDYQYDTSTALAYSGLAAYWVWTTRYAQDGASNVSLSGPSHSDLHEPPVWSTIQTYYPSCVAH